MTDQTRAAVSAILAADRTVKESTAGEALAILSGRRASIADDKPITRRDAAEMLGVSKVTVTNWAREGIIKRFSVKGRRKAFGYSLRSINSVMRDASKAGSMKG